MKRPPELAVLNATFPLSGVMTTLLGPLLPSLVAAWSLSDARAGQLFLAQFLANTTGAILSGTLAARLGANWLIGGSYALMGVAVWMLALVPPLAGLGCIAAYGFALGASIPAVNIGATERAPGHELAQLNILNTAWCLGALLAPPAVAFLLRAQTMGFVLAALGVLCVAAGIACLAFLSPVRARSSTTEAKPAKVDASLRNATMATAFFLFLYVGVENGLNGWLPLLAQRSQESTRSGALALSAFWASILIARFLVSLWPERFAPASWVRAGVATALLGVALLLAFHSTPAIFLCGSALAGLGLGPVFPTAVAMFHSRSSGRLMGLVFASAGFGGATLPWLIGVISSSSGNLRTALATVLAALTAMILTRL